MELEVPGYLQFLTKKSWVGVRDLHPMNGLAIRNAAALLHYTG